MLKETFIVLNFVNLSNFISNITLMLHNKLQIFLKLMWCYIFIFFCCMFSGRAEPSVGVGDPCAGCNKPIIDKFLLNVLDRVWHSHCVRCCECLQPLTDKCFSREAKLYCRNDFFR